LRRRVAESGRAPPEPQQSWPLRPLKQADRAEDDARIAAPVNGLEDERGAARQEPPPPFLLSLPPAKVEALREAHRRAEGREPRGSAFGTGGRWQEQREAAAGKGRPVRLSSCWSGAGTKHLAQNQRWGGGRAAAAATSAPARSTRSAAARSAYSVSLSAVDSLAAQRLERAEEQMLRIPASA
jgi:hypothetical protein